ncbi:hypothetical protein D9758_001960 [Tetrapyrgos nigripes]|uniref:UTP--glucose-1-phosphate uridylyltransferase n=1 Tax=Tetrapyrgos nigripes TaxID=182062 RepID=A0A8H5LUS9_9AGAR|nr:hypothetical protein D9758_001960 [Tetrapyrgos nigripes]
MHLFKYPRRRFRRRRVPSSASLRNSASLPLSPTAIEIKKLINTEADGSARKAFENEMNSFLKLLSRYLEQKSRPPSLDWSTIKALAPDQVIPYEELTESASIDSLKKLAILKLNGGLGTTMGMQGGTKAALEVHNGLTFLDMTMQQVLHVNSTHNVDVPLLFMTSFSTYDETLRITRKYANQPIKVTLFNQSRYPQVAENTYLPCPKNTNEGKTWYPPGHGDLYTALDRSGVLDALLSQGKEYVFVSNSDNLGATVDEKILQHMITCKSDFLIEVTNKTNKDDTGGSVVDYDGVVRLVELEQVPPEHVQDFMSAKHFKSFNTNSMWISLKAIKRIIGKGELELEIFEKRVSGENERAYIQLETAAASAVKYFEKPKVINVSRSRFLPVKTCSDLLLIRSDVYQIQNGCLVLNDNRLFQSPTIKLSDQFRSVDQFQRRFKTVPSMVDLDLLTVTGDVHFGRNVTLRGIIIVAAEEGRRIDIPDGCILENRLVTGNLNMIEL